MANTGIFNLPSSEFKLVSRNSHTEFPSIGSEDTLYIDKSENKLYRWDAQSLKYEVVGTNYNDITIINGGNSL